MENEKLILFAVLFGENQQKILLILPTKVHSLALKDVFKHAPMKISKDNEYM